MYVIEIDARKYINLKKNIFSKNNINTVNGETRMVYVGDNKQTKTANFTDVTLAPLIYPVIMRHFSMTRNIFGTIVGLFRTEAFNAYGTFTITFDNPITESGDLNVLIDLEYERKRGTTSLNSDNYNQSSPVSNTFTTTASLTLQSLLPPPKIQHKNWLGAVLGSSELPDNQYIPLKQTRLSDYSIKFDFRIYAKTVAMKRWYALIGGENFSEQKEIKSITFTINSETVTFDKFDFNVTQANVGNIKPFKITGNELLQTDAIYGGTTPLYDKISNDIINTYKNNRRTITFDLLNPYYQVYNEELEEYVDVAFKAGDIIKVKDLNGQFIFNGAELEIISIEQKYTSQRIMYVMAIEKIVL